MRDDPLGLVLYLKSRLSVALMVGLRVPDPENRVIVLVVS